MSGPELGQKSNNSRTNVTETPLKPPFFQRFKTHMKRWWWAYVIGFCVVVLVTVLPLVYVGVPNFANKYINDYQYNYNDLSITNPTPNSFHVHQKQNLNAGGFSGSGHLSAFNATIRASGSDIPFAVFPVQEIEFGGNSDFTIDQDLNIACVECLSRLAADAVAKKEISVLVTGKPDLKVGGLPTAHLDVHKTMAMKGYNVEEYLDAPGSFNVTSVNLLKPPTSEGYNVNATVAFRNPSPFIVEIGSVSFNLSISGTSMGYVDIPNLYLQKDITETTVLGDIDIDVLVRKALGNGSPNDDFGDVTIDISGNKVYYKGEEIPYFSAAMQAIKAPVKVNLLDYASEFL
ncbi:DUF3712 domain-containing protein [Aspergillus chevalieri]|uniref:Uncharacterized protein n=1 Tax=Aspergillus chevalieri TaxID=182096 RepID=A0A7R7VEI1_ASPCH|nr:uncharacterized protein ACHE_10164S [Aspergillus chevalieri]BCR82762.1 hypothetical protein ACHE_10164S [Aspergillus chevalieri]